MPRPEPVRPSSGKSTSSDDSSVVLMIGGGITGAGVALGPAQGLLRASLVENCGSGASSSLSKQVYEVPRYRSPRGASDRRFPS